MFYYVKFTALSIKTILQGSISFSFQDILQFIEIRDIKMLELFYT